MAKRTNEMAAVDSGVESLRDMPTLSTTGGGYRVAILDDSQLLVDTLSDMLTMKGFPTEGFQDARSLLSRCMIGPKFDAFLLDWSLQDDENSGQFIPALRECAPTAAMIVMSGHFNDTSINVDVVQMAERYSLLLLSKPARGTAIIKSLMTLLRDPPVST